MHFSFNLLFALRVALFVSLNLPETIGYSTFKSEQQPKDDKEIKEANKQVECGVSSGNKIRLNEDGLEITSYPWFVLLEYQSIAAYNQIRCAGVIVDDLHILTSAYCAKRSPISIRYGELVPNCTQSDTVLYLCLNPSEHAFISETRTHPSAFLRSYERHSALALLRLAKRLEFNDFVRPICLNTDENGFDSSKHFFYPQWNLQVNQLPSETFIKRSLVEEFNTCNDIFESKLTTLKDKLVCVNDHLSM